VSLTNTAIRRSRAAEKPHKLADGQGLHLLVNPSGSKLWRWKYRHSGKEKLMPFGAYPDVSLANARVRLAEARRMLAAGIDPMAQRKVAKEAGNEASENPFSAIAALWFDHWKVTLVSSSTGSAPNAKANILAPTAIFRGSESIDALCSLRDGLYR